MDKYADLSDCNPVTIEELREAFTLKRDLDTTIDEYKREIILLENDLERLRFVLFVLKNAKH
jgi:hypothetical protein